MTTHWLLPILLDNSIKPAGIISASPSPTVNSNGPPVRIPPFEIQPVDADTVNSSISHTEVLSPFPIGQKGSILTSKVVASLTAKPSITERLSVYCCHSCVVATLSSCNNTAPVLSNICTPKNWA